jgi:SAM-dependent methyltransferase
VKPSEFDRFADEYLAAHTENVAITGEDPDYFARYKIQEISRLYKSRRLSSPARILDFGCGIGSSIAHLKAAFPQAQIVGLDVSARSLAIARQRFPHAASYEIYDGAEIRLAKHSYDLIFSSCVFHHIEAAEHLSIFRQLRGLLAADGAMIVFEHNPVNPVTRYIVATCPFDENAVLIPARDFVRRQRDAGFGSIEVAYTGFFPGGLRGLRPLEPFLRSVPLGAQYYTFARA